METSDISHLTQPTFVHFFKELLKTVNKDYGFNIIEGEFPRCERNDLASDSSRMTHVTLYYHGDYGTPNALEFKTSYIDDCFASTPQNAAEKLENDLRTALDEIVAKLDSKD